MLPIRYSNLTSYRNRHLNPERDLGSPEPKRSMVSSVLFKNRSPPNLTPSQPSLCWYTTSDWNAARRDWKRLNASLVTVRCSLPRATSGFDSYGPFGSLASGQSKKRFVRISSVQSSVIVQRLFADTMFGDLEAYILKLKITYLAWYSTCEPRLCRHRVMRVYSSAWDVPHLLGRSFVVCVCIPPQRRTAAKRMKLPVNIVGSSSKKASWNSMRELPSGPSTSLTRGIG